MGTVEDMYSLYIVFIGVNVWGYAKIQIGCMVDV